MKRKKMLESMNLLDDKYIEEASRDAAISRRRTRTWVRYAALAACFALLLTGSIWLTVPYKTQPPSVAKYEDSEYFPVIEKLNLLNFEAPRYKNRLDKLLSQGIDLGIKDEDMSGDVVEDAANGSLTMNGASRYEETTDNQVAGVIEADLMKRTSTHIFYMGEEGLKVYSINKENSELIGTYKLGIPSDARYFLPHLTEFYLSEDGNTLTYLLTYHTKLSRKVTHIVALDVSDPANITQKKSVTITGGIISSRVVEGKLLLIGDFYVGRNPNFSDESTFIPQIDTGNGPQSLPIEDIVMPETITTSSYTVVSQFDIATLTLQSCTAFLSYSNQVYVSRDSVYVTRGYNDRKEDGKFTVSTSMTEISRLSYAGEGFEYKGSVVLAGYIKDQYSLDEHEGVLRVVTTTSSNQYLTQSGHTNVSWELVDGVADAVSGTNASLYCVELSTMKVVASVEEFAPVGETVRSVRFDGDAAYVCTSIRMTDPVFFFDLSDLENIVCKDTGTIEGFSTSLIHMGDGFLLGIGVGDSVTFKIEVYEETEDGVRSVCSYELRNAYASSSYKSYLVDRERDLIGLGLTYYGGKQSEDYYVLLHFDGTELIELVHQELKGANDYKRAAYVDGYLYMLSHEDFAVVQVEQQ